MHKQKIRRQPQNGLHSLKIHLRLRKTHFLTLRQSTRKPSSFETTLTLPQKIPNESHTRLIVLNPPAERFLQRLNIKIDGRQVKTLKSVAYDLSVFLYLRAWWTLINLNEEITGGEGQSLRRDSRPPLRSHLHHGLPQQGSALRRRSLHRR